jgi:ribosomal protein S18 acetylase RimI-like enzyme
MATIFITRVETISSELLAGFERLLPQLTNAPSPTFVELQKILNSPSVLVVAHLSDQAGPIVGTGTLGVFYTPSGRHAHIEDIVVDEGMRRLGIGEALVQHLLGVAREMGLQGVSLTCNPRRAEANRLYKKMGFKNWETNVFWYEFD